MKQSQSFEFSEHLPKLPLIQIPFFTGINPAIVEGQKFLYLLRWRVEEDNGESCLEGRFGVRQLADQHSQEGSLV